jgi:sugar/nucleoside kinase (ribokinase family)
MGETRSERPSCSEYFIISQQAAIKSGVDRLQATSDRHLVLTGQSLEVNRQALETCRQALEAIRAMGKPTEQSSGPVKSLWASVKEWLSGFVLLQKAWSAFWAVWPKISWPVNITLWGSGAAKWLGWL